MTLPEIALQSVALWLAVNLCGFIVALFAAFVWTLSRD